MPKVNWFTRLVAETLAWWAIVKIFFWVLAAVSAAAVLVFGVDGGRPWIEIITFAAVTFYAIAGGLNQISRAVERYRGRANNSKPSPDDSPRLVEDESSAALKTKYKWMFDISEEQRANIQRYIHVVGPDINRHEMLTGSPYIEFRFALDSRAVYPARLGSVGGSIYFKGRRLNVAPKWSGNDRKDIEPLGVLGPVMLLQELSREEAIFILNQSGDGARFDFRGLEVRVESPGHPEVERQLLSFTDNTTSNEGLLKAYPKLNINIRQAIFRGYWDWRDMHRQGFQINMNVGLTNARQAAVEIQKFKLTFRLDDQDFSAYAEAGEIHEYRSVGEDGVEQFQGQSLENLNPQGGQTLTSERGHPREGWLQFVIKDAGFRDFDADEPEELPAKLMITDRSGEEHSAECMLLYKTS